MRSPARAPRRASHKALWLACTPLCAGVSWTIQGCNATCDTSVSDNPLVLITQGSSDGSNYDSLGPDRVFVHVLAGQQFAFEHKFRHAPLQISTYLSFDCDAASATMAEGAGDPVNITCFDDRAIVVHNDTCSEWWLRVVASGEVPAEAMPKKHSCAPQLFPDESEAGGASPVDAALPDFGR